MNIFKFMMETRKPVIQLDFDLLDKSLKASIGSRILSPEDTKMAIVAISGIVRQQRELLEKLYDTLGTIEIDEPPSIWKKLFKN